MAVRHLSGICVNYYIAFGANTVARPELTIIVVVVPVGGIMLGGLLAKTWVSCAIDTPHPFASSDVPSCKVSLEQLLALPMKFELLVREH